MTELLYLKQTQLERMAAEKAAQQMALERALAVAREEAARVQRCAAARAARRRCPLRQRRGVLAAAGARARWCYGLRGGEAVAHAIVHEQLQQTCLDSANAVWCMPGSRAGHSAARPYQFRARPLLRLPMPRGRRAGRRTRTERAAAAFGGEAEGVVPMEAVSEAYCRLAANRSVGGAVRAAARRGPRTLARL